jgi:hypothetical protein
MLAAQPPSPTPSPPCILTGVKNALHPFPLDLFLTSPPLEGVGINQNLCPPPLCSWTGIFSSPFKGEAGRGMGLRQD